MKTLESLRFENSALQRLPLDPVKENYVRRSVKNACFSLVNTSPIRNPRLVAYSAEALALLGLPESEVNRAEFVDYFAGNKIMPGSQVAAHCYCGHQFGNFAGQLGDGRAVYLGEVIGQAASGSGTARWELQLKGAGQTPYSRDADGRAVLRSSIREFLCSEAMFHLGIPTTRAGTVITSDTYVKRDLHYNGNVKDERATVVLRIAPTFIRFGSFQVVLPRDPVTGREGPSPRNAELLAKLVDYVIEYHYPMIWTSEQSLEKKRLAFYREVVLRTARLVAEWQCVGWAHGVLNTDNMSIVGVTIDFGPFGFLDRHDAGFICNSSDKGGRYSFGNQPQMVAWNCERLSDALAFILPSDDLKRAFTEFWPEYERHHLAKMRRKLGLRKELPDDKQLVEHLLRTMQDTGADHTNTLRALARVPVAVAHAADAATRSALLDYLVSQTATLNALKRASKPSVPRAQLNQMLAMARMQPAILMMMGVDPEQLQLEEDKWVKYEHIATMTEVDRASTVRKLWTEWLDVYSARLSLEATAGEGDDLKRINAERTALMNSNNPRFILRNYIAQNAIEKAEEGDYSEVRRVLEILKNPFQEEVPAQLLSRNYDSLPPESAYDICVS